MLTWLPILNDEIEKFMLIQNINKAMVSLWY